HAQPPDDRTGTRLERVPVAVLRSARRQCQRPASQHHRLAAHPKALLRSRRLLLLRHGLSPWPDAPPARFLMRDGVRRTWTARLRIAPCRRACEAATAVLCCRQAGNERTCSGPTGSPAGTAVG